MVFRPYSSQSCGSLLSVSEPGQRTLALGPGATCAHLGDVRPDRGLDRFVEANLARGDLAQCGDAWLIVALHKRHGRLASWRARSAPRTTRAKRFGTFSKQSSTVTRAKVASGAKCEGPDIKAEAAKVKRRRAFQALKANRRDKDHNRTAKPLRHCKVFTWILG
jgi:hypothetical protein